jgi:uncharacterized protein (DUF58 family)
MRRGGGALLLGVVALVGAAAFGSRALAVVGIGLLLAGGLGRMWAALARSRAHASAVAEPTPATEGDEIRLALEIRRESRIPIGAAFADAKLGRLGHVRCRLRGRGPTLRGEIELGRPPRGRFRMSEAMLELGDPLGLETVTLPLELPVAVVVQPRLVELEMLFSDAGRVGSDGRRLLLRRQAGFDFHSVRGYEQGESLRRVHWPSTARRGELMVKELEESPHDAVVVLLDCDPAGAAGTPPDSSFDTAVRAAGSVLRAHSRRGRKAALVTTGTEATVAPVRSHAGDFAAAVTVLAAAEADAPHALDRALARAGPATVAGELVVVTAVLEAPALDRLLGLGSRQSLSVIWVDAPSFAGRPTRMPSGVLRLMASGIPVAVVRSGEDLRTALSAPDVKAQAHA